MQKDTLLSLLRTILTLVGSFIVGHSVLGHSIMSETWDVISGSALTLISAIWGIADKSVGIEKFQSLVRSVFISIGGLLVAAGRITGQTLEAITGLIIPISTLIQSYTSKRKVQDIHNGDLRTTAAGKVVKIIIIVCLFSMKGNTQSILKSLPKSVAVTSEVTVVQPKVGDSILNTFRPLIGVAAFSEPGNQLMTGAGAGYQSLKWNYTTQKWESRWSVSILFWAAGSVSPGPQSAAFAFGPAIGLFNNLLLFGGAYDYTHGQYIGVLSLGISLNN